MITMHKDQATARKYGAYIPASRVMQLWSKDKSGVALVVLVYAAEKIWRDESTGETNNGEIPLGASELSRSGIGSTKSVRRAIRLLEHHGLLVRTKNWGNGRVSRYALAWIHH